MKIKSPRKLILSILLCQAAGLSAALFTGSSILDWYPTLIQPSFTPPSWVFSPVWTLLYLMMGLALYLVWIKSNKTKYRELALWVFALQLILNNFWAMVFFGLKNPGAAFVVILVLWAMIFANILAFWKIDRNAGAMLIPYLAWVSFASVLNYSIWILNM